jgi:hypothetical protein
MRRAQEMRYATLHEIEHGGNETAEVAELISTAVLRRHLETMLRLDIEYDFLPRESEILHLKFWEAAFEQLKQTGVLYFENEGKNKGCWVMTRPGAETTEGETDEDAKVIVRSNGTVTYVGKDIAYHLWKFGLLGKDFGYKPFFTYPDHECWISAEKARAPSALRRRAGHLQRHRLAPVRPAGQCDPGACAAWATPSRPIATRTSVMRWWRSRRAAPSSWATTFPKRTWPGLTSKSAAARASASRPTT